MTMASAMKSKISQAVTSTNSDSTLKQEAQKYRLLVTAGPSYDLKQHKPINVNSEIPTFIENDYIRAKINVRVKGFRGLPSSSPSTASYFDNALHQKDQYSLGFSFVPKQDLPSRNTVWGNDLDHSIRDRIPPGFNTAFRIVKEFIDPGLQCDVYADQPWLYGHSLSSWFALRIGDEFREDEDFPAPGLLTEGADGTGQKVREGLGLPENNEKRRKHFLEAKNRERFVFEKGRLYQSDFYNPYLDFANFALKLPGFSLKVIKYIGEKTHCLRYVFKNRETGAVYFNVNFTLLWGEQLEKALEEDQTTGVDLNEKLQGVNGGEERHEQDQANGSDASEHYHSLESESDEARESDEKQVRSTTQAPKMQLHPGDHTAAAEAMVAKKVDEIDELLKQTSTSQKRGGLMLDEID